MEKEWKSSTRQENNKTQESLSKVVINWVMGTQ